jgi:hypothetical protein
MYSKKFWIFLTIFALVSIGIIFFLSFGNVFPNDWSNSSKYIVMIFVGFLLGHLTYIFAYILED